MDPTPNIPCPNKCGHSIYVKRTGVKHAVQTMNEDPTGWFAIKCERCGFEYELADDPSQLRMRPRSVQT